MVAYLGNRVKQGTHDSQNPLGSGNWTVAFTPADLATRVHSQVHHIAIAGPAGSSFQVYIDTTFYDYVARGDVNSWDPSQTMPVQAGQTLYFYWNTAATPAPKVTLFLQQTTGI